MPSLPENIHGEPPPRLESRGNDVREGGGISWQSEEIIRFGAGEDHAEWYAAKRFAIVRYRLFRTDRGERFEIKAWLRQRAETDVRPYPTSAYNLIHVYVEPEQNCAWLGPKGWIIMAEQGEGIGSYLLCAALTWLKDHYPSAQIATGWLSYVDGRSSENRLRRDAFYRRQGFHIYYRNFETGDGSFWAPVAAGLTPNWNEGKVHRVTTWDAVSLMTTQARELATTNIELRGLRKSRGELLRHLWRWQKVAISAVIVTIVTAYALAVLAR